MRRPRTSSLFSRDFPEILRRALQVLLLGAVVGLLAGCSADNRAVLHTDKGDFAFNVEIADTEATRSKGLMFRESLAADAGMLFDYHREQLASFWMQNTLIPLDMVFIAADGTVKTIHVNARPMDTTSIPSEVPIRFVLEIKGGRSVEIGLKPGDKFEHIRVGTAN